MTSNLTIPSDYLEECEKRLFAAKFTGERAFIFLSRSQSKPVHLVTVESYKDLLLALISNANPEDLSFFEDHTENQAQKFLKEIALGKSDLDIFPVQVTSSSFLALGLLKGVIADSKPNVPSSKKIDEYVNLLAKKHTLGVKSKIKIKEYITSRSPNLRFALIDNLLTNTSTQIHEMFSEDGLEEAEEELIQNLPAESRQGSWLSIYEKFAEVWFKEKDPKKRKQVYRDLGYTKNPKKSPEENKKVLAGIFKVKYEALSDEEKGDFSKYLDLARPTLGKAKRLLGI